MEVNIQRDVAILKDPEQIFAATTLAVRQGIQEASDADLMGSVVVKSSEAVALEKTQGNPDTAPILPTGFIVLGKANGETVYEKLVALSWFSSATSISPQRLTRTERRATKKVLKRLGLKMSADGK